MKKNKLIMCSIILKWFNCNSSTHFHFFLFKQRYKASNLIMCLKRFNKKNEVPVVIVRKRSWPAVSHICILMRFPSISTVLILKSILKPEVIIQDSVQNHEALMYAYIGTYASRLGAYILTNHKYMELCPLKDSHNKFLLTKFCIRTQ